MITKAEMKERAKLIGKFVQGKITKEEFERLEELEHKNFETTLDKE